ncbi:MAG: bacterial Ig-like domain-containing protein [Clostridiales bacterium]|nr:bacterial Ig-like domain-containing protein [Clostridiales bacterium]
MKKFLKIVLIFALCASLMPNVYAAGVKEPVINSELPDFSLYIGSDPMVFFADASSPDGGTLEYLWYSTTQNDISTIYAILDATDDYYSPPVKEGVVYYCYAVWNVKNGLRSSPVYSRLIRMEYIDDTPVPSQLEISQTPNKLVYSCGEALDLTGLKVRVWLSDGYLDLYDGANVEVSTGSTDDKGYQTVQVTYQNSKGFVYSFFTVQYNHSFGSWKTTAEPTCTENGQKSRECVCGYTEHADIAATGHHWDDGKITTNPTETSTGVKTFTCTLCKATRTEEIPVLASSSETSSETIATEAAGTNASSAEDESEATEAAGTPAAGEEKTDAAEITEPPASASESEISQGQDVQTSGENGSNPSPDAPEKDLTFLWWILGAAGAVILLGGAAAVVVVLLIKKKK